MSDIFEIKEDFEISEINCRGLKNFRDLKALASEVCTACTEHAGSKILINNDSKLSIYSLYCLLIIELVKKPSIPQDQKIALVDPSEWKTEADNRILINVAEQRGFNNIRIFEETEKAKIWLRDSRIN